MINRRHVLIAGAASAAMASSGITLLDTAKKTARAEPVTAGTAMVAIAAVQATLQIANFMNKSSQVNWGQRNFEYLGLISQQLTVMSGQLREIRNTLARIEASTEWLVERERAADLIKIQEEIAVLAARFFVASTDSSLLEDVIKRYDDILGRIIANTIDGYTSNNPEIVGLCMLMWNPYITALTLAGKSAQTVGNALLQLGRIVGTRSSRFKVGGYLGQIEALSYLEQSHIGSIIGSTGLVGYIRDPKYDNDIIIRLVDKDPEALLQLANERHSAPTFLVGTHTTTSDPYFHFQDESKRISHCEQWGCLNEMMSFRIGERPFNYHSGGQLNFVRFLEVELISTSPLLVIGAGGRTLDDETRRAAKFVNRFNYGIDTLNRSVVEYNKSLATRVMWEILGPIIDEVDKQMRQQFFALREEGAFQNP